MPAYTSITARNAATKCGLPFGLTSYWIEPSQLSHAGLAPCAGSSTTHNAQYFSLCDPVDFRVILPSVFGGDRGVTMAYPLSTRISSLIAIAAVACAIAVVLHPIANAQSLDNQQKCSREAKRAFEELRREYDAEVRGLQLKVD